MRAIKTHICFIRESKCCRVLINHLFKIGELIKIFDNMLWQLTTCDDALVCFSKKFKTLYILAITS